MASSRSSSLCRSIPPEMSWSTRFSRAAVAQMGVDLATLQNSVHADVLAALKEEHHELSRNQLSKLEREFEQLRATTYHPPDAITGSIASRGPVGLRDLIEREMQAQAQLTSQDRNSSPTRSRMGQSSHHRAQSVDRSCAYTGRGYPERSNAETSFASQKMSRISELYKELEKMDLALQEAHQENDRLKEEKAACVAAHERDVAALESMLKSVMDENAALKTSLGATRARSLPKISSRTMPEDLQRNIITDLIQSGISPVPQTPTSEGTSSTHTPPFEPEAEVSSLDISRGSMDAFRMGTRSP